MSLLLQIKKDQLKSRKEKDKLKSEVLTTLISEAQMIGKNDGNRETTEIEIVQLIKKYIKTNEETQDAVAQRNASEQTVQRLKDEKQILESYLPEQLDEDELNWAIDDIIEKLTEIEGTLSKRHMGLIMKELMVRHEGRLDGKIASNLVRQKLDQI